MSSSSYGRLEQYVRELEIIKAKRQSRDTWAFSRALLNTAKSLRDDFGAWRREEIGALRKQSAVLSELADTHEAKLRIERINADLNQLEGERMPDVVSRIETFITKLETGEVPNPDDLATNFTENLMPAVGLIFKLTNIRNELDAMGDMVPR